MKRFGLIFVLVAFVSCSKQVKETETTQEWKLIKNRQEALMQKKKMLSEMSSASVSEMYDISYQGYELDNIRLSDARVIFRVKVDLRRKFWNGYFKALNYVHEAQGIEVCANYRVERVRGYDDRVKLVGIKYYLHPHLKPYIIQPKKAYIVITINGIDFRAQTILYERFYGLSFRSFPGCEETVVRGRAIRDAGIIIPLSVNVNPELLRQEPKISVRLE